MTLRAFVCAARISGEGAVAKNLIIFDTGSPLRLTPRLGVATVATCSVEPENRISLARSVLSGCPRKESDFVSVQCL